MARVTVEVATARWRATPEKLPHSATSIIRRAAHVEEVANMILYASSEQASATTGAALRVDGGVVDSIV
ncbi:SDR family oxidoreductase [Variovorax sp. CY25R-8]|nr:SDR family oxidoreductase [Variovorax sp. CY25R-8]